MKHTNYVYIPEYKESCKYDKFTEPTNWHLIMDVKLFFLNKVIKIPHQLFSPIEYMSSELISLNKEPYFDVFEERIKLIQQRDKIFNNILTGMVT